MLYLIDEDNSNAIVETYKCGFIFEPQYSTILKYFKKESEIDIEPENLKENDIVCYHNSFPNEKSKILNRINFLNEEKQAFHTICFSGDSSFYITEIEGKNIKLHKDRFYYNLRAFLNSGFDFNSLLYGEYTNKNEGRIIITRIFSMLFNISNDAPFDIKLIRPMDLKRLCELAKYDYQILLSKISDISVGDFRNTISYLTKSI